MKPVLSVTRSHLVTLRVNEFNFLGSFLIEIKIFADNTTDLFNLPSKTL